MGPNLTAVLMNEGNLDTHRDTRVVHTQPDK